MTRECPYGDPIRLRDAPVAGNRHIQPISVETEFYLRFFRDTRYWNDKNKIIPLLDNTIIVVFLGSLPRSLPNQLARRASIIVIFAEEVDAKVANWRGPAGREMIILIFGMRAVVEADQAPATLGELLLAIYRLVRSWILNMLAVLIGRRKKFNRAPVGGKLSIFH